MQSKAKIVIIGGGVMGCSLAYHLCKEGETDVVLLEKGELTSGSTWHAAGQITHSVSHYSLARMAAYGTDLYPRLEDETGQSCTWHGSGSLRIAYTRDEVDWIRYTLSVGKGLGHEMEIVGPERIAELHPFYNLEGVRAALYTPHDGHVDPAGVAFAMAKGARMMGGTVIRQNRVTGITRSGDRFVVHTEQGDIEAERVVNAGGTYARQVGAWVGLELPIANMLHHYLITDTVPEFEALERELPVIRDDSQVSGYIRMEQKSGLIGIYEKANAASVWDDGTPWESENELFEPDYDRIMPWLENALERMPILADKGIKSVVHGAITHPPDGNMLLGPSGVKNFWLCCGSQVGIAWGPGAGKYLAQWMVRGAADVSMRSFDPRRFGARIDDDYRINKAKEDYLLRHEIPYPHLDRPALRPSHSKLSALYETLKSRGAVYEDVYGWERPYWYAVGGVEQKHIESFRRSPLFDIVGNEVRGMRAHAGIADLTAFAKVEVSGADAGLFLDRVQSNNLPQKIGSVSLTYLMMENGRIEGEATLVKLADNHYYMVYAAVREAALLNWMRQQARAGEDVEFKNVSEAYGVIMLAGPASRRILAACTDVALDNASFRWLSMQHLTVAGTDEVRALRVTYTGELGWELHVPMDGMLDVYGALLSTPHSAGLVHVGSATLNSVRMEKAYRSGSEITNEVTLSEADVTRFARAGGFQGATASLRPATRWVLAYLQLEEATADSVSCDPLGSESVWHQGRPVGQISSGGYGYDRGRYLAFAYIKPGLNRVGNEFDVMVMGEPRRAVIVAQCVYDPGNLLPRSED
ncbi:MAG: FAD-dependent oxidoreductase [Gammaproteobacteria bacterium]|nr:FAD-dependent oxidoreductase [Gammaproteobacteria bacterium]MDH3446970.1 FAD-dependent oxidoreductase [Gammaproteobacteria bacterium]